MRALGLEDRKLSSSEVIQLKGKDVGNASWFHLDWTILLLALGILFLILELKTPGIGISGVLGIALPRRVLPRSTPGSGGVDAAITIGLLLIGFLLLLVEVVFLPGFGVPGILGVLLILFSIYAASIGLPGDTLREQLIPDSDEDFVRLRAWLIQFLGIRSWRRRSARSSSRPGSTGFPLFNRAFLAPALAGPGAASAAPPRTAASARRAASTSTWAPAASRRRTSGPPGSRASATTRSTSSPTASTSPRHADRRHGDRRPSRRGQGRARMTWPSSCSSPPPRFMMLEVMIPSFGMLGLLRATALHLRGRPRVQDEHGRRVHRRGRGPRRSCRQRSCLDSGSSARRRSAEDAARRAGRRFDPARLHREHRRARSASPASPLTDLRPDRRRRDRRRPDRRDRRDGIRPERILPSPWSRRWNAHRRRARVRRIEPKKEPSP